MNIKTRENIIFQRTDYPEQCPPSNSVDFPIKLWRLIRNDEPLDSDFVDWDKEPHNQGKPNHKCSHKSMSLFKPNSYAYKMAMKLKGFRKHQKGYVEITLDSDCGIVTQTGDDGHYSWWKYSSYEPLNNIDNIEVFNE